MPTSQVELQEISAFTGVALRKTMTLKQIPDFAGEALPVILKAEEYQILTVFTQAR